MLQPISLVVATLWSDEAATFLVKALHDLQAANLQWSFEVIVVICHATPLKGEDIPAAPTGLPFTTRIYQTHSTNLEEGEALGAWLAYGDVLTFWRLGGDLGCLPICDPSHAESHDVVLGWGPVWAVAKRTFWKRRLFTVTEAWPSEVSFVDLGPPPEVPIPEPVEIASLTPPSDSKAVKETELLEEIKQGSIDDKEEDDVEEEEVKEENAQELVVRLEPTEGSQKFDPPSPLPRHPLPIKTSFIGSNYRQWKWKHLKSIRMAKATPYAVYSCVFGYPGASCHSMSSQKDVVSDAIFFTDMPWPRRNNGWTVVYLPNLFVFQSSCRDPPQTMSRIPKLLPCEFLPHYAATLYIDNNIIVKRPISRMIRIMLGKKEWGALRHKRRHCAYKEIDACIRHHKDRRDFLEAQRRAYLRAKLPRGAGLAENPVIARVSSPRVTKICHLWWNETQRFSKRDQISFAFVAWKQKYWRHLHLAPRSYLGGREAGAICSKGSKMGSGITGSIPIRGSRVTAFATGGRRSTRSTNTQKSAQKKSKPKAVKTKGHITRSRKLERLLALVRNK